MSEEKGHNSLTATSKEKLRQFVQKIETLNDEKAEIAEQIREVYAEVKALGFDAKALRKVIALRKIDEQERAEMEMMLDLYMSVLM